MAGTWSPPAKPLVPKGQHPACRLGCCPAASLGWVAELLNGLEDSLHVAHLGDPQVLQEGERGADVHVGGQLSALAGRGAAGRRTRVQSPAPHALPARAWSWLGSPLPPCKHVPVPGCRRGQGAVDPALGRRTEPCKPGGQGQAPPSASSPWVRVQPCRGGCRVVSTCLSPPHTPHEGWREEVWRTPCYPGLGVPQGGTRGVVPSGLSSPAGSTQSPGCHAGQKCLCTPLNRALPAKLPPPRSPTCPLAGRKTTEVDGPPWRQRDAAGQAAAIVPLSCPQL